MDSERMVKKFAALNERVAREQRLKEIQERLDWMVLGGKLEYVPETGEYIRLSEHDGLFGSNEAGEKG